MPVHVHSCINSISLAAALNVMQCAGTSPQQTSDKCTSNSDRVSGILLLLVLEVLFPYFYSSMCMSVVWY